jgi:hypothetical protein
MQEYDCLEEYLALGASSIFMIDATGTITKTIGKNMINTITVKFYRYDDVGNPVVVHTEQCHDIFEAEQLVSDDKHQYDAVEIIDHTTPPGK